MDRRNETELLVGCGLVFEDDKYHWSKTWSNAAERRVVEETGPQTPRFQGKRPDQEQAKKDGPVEE